MNGKVVKVKEEVKVGDDTSATVDLGLLIMSRTEG